jgi:hypothetical protein
MTRNGKIARLPGFVREELNTRLDDGQQGESLLDWLHGLPEVQASLEENFQGAPITKQNLSEWRKGGFREWQVRRELCHHACQLAESVLEMNMALDGASLPGALAAMLAARYAAVLNAWDGAPSEDIEAQLRLLHRLNQDIALLQRTRQRDLRQQAEWAQAATAQPVGPGESKPVQPSPSESNPVQPSPSESKLVQLNPTESNPAKPVKSASWVMEEAWARLRSGAHPSPDASALKEAASSGCGGCGGCPQSHAHGDQQPAKL